MKKKLNLHAPWDYRSDTEYSAFASHLVQLKSNVRISVCKRLMKTLETRILKIEKSFQKETIFGCTKFYTPDSGKRQIGHIIAAGVVGEQVHFLAPIPPFTILQRMLLKGISNYQVLPDSGFVFVMTTNKKNLTHIWRPSEDVESLVVLDKSFKLWCHRMKQYEFIQKLLKRVLLLSKHEESLKITFGSKKLHNVEPRAFYSLWIGSSPVYEFQEKSIVYMSSRSLSAPFKLRTLPKHRFSIDERILDIPLDRRVKVGEFCDDRGVRISKNMAEFARNLFDQVRQGVPIFPQDSSINVANPSSVPQSSQKINKFQPRTWAQKHLDSLKPDVTTFGELLGSGNSYKAYGFGRTTVVEFDCTEHATYVFETKFFNSLRNWTRTEIKNSNPKGLIATIVHVESTKERWFSRVSFYIKKNQEPKSPRV